MTTRVLALALLAIPVWAAVAVADEIAKRATVKAGETVLVTAHKNWTRSCGSAVRPPITITSEPQGGTIEIKPGEYEIEGVRHLGSDTSCIGKMVPGNGIYYTARPDFKGEDTFKYKVRLGIDRGSTDYFYVVRVRVR
jgi:hypothetical protein